MEENVEVVATDENKGKTPLKRRFAFRVGFPVLIILFLSISASIVGYYLFARGQFDIMYHKEMQTAAASLQAALEVGMVANDRDMIRKVMEDGSSNKLYARAMVLDRLGYVKVSSDKSMKNDIFSLEQEECRTCHGANPRKGGIHMTSGIVQLPPDKKTGQRLHRTVKPILAKPECRSCHGEKLLGFLVMDFDDSSFRSMMSKSVTRFGATGALTLLFVCGAFLFFLNCNLGKPMGRMLHGIRKVGGGDFDHKLPEFSSAEFTEISRQFNNMADSIKAHMEDIEKKSGRIEELTRLKNEISKMNQRLNQKVLELYMLHEIGKAVNSTLDLDLLFHIVMDMTKTALGIQDFCIFLYNEESGCLEVKASYGLGEFAKEIRFVPGEGITGEVFTSGETRVVNDTAKEPSFQFYKGAKPGIGSFLATPLAVKGKVFGVLNIDRAEPNAISPEDIDLYTALANQIAIAVENARMYEITKRMSHTDTLTGLYNHGYFQNTLREMLGVPSKNVSLLMIDIDHFKKVNDTYGHGAGDTVLRDISKILQQCLRREDIVSRYGGEEFAIILPETGEPQAAIIAERIRRQVEGHDFHVTQVPDQVHLRITVSIGISHYEAHMTPEDFMGAADAALYEAKEAGRNRVVSSAA